MTSVSETRRFLWHKLRECETRDGRVIVNEAMDLRCLYPDLSGGELIRLAYWGASGERSG